MLGSAQRLLMQAGRSGGKAELGVTSLPLDSKKEEMLAIVK